MLGSAGPSLPARRMPADQVHGRAGAHGRRQSFHLAGIGFL